MKFKTKAENGIYDFLRDQFENNPIKTEGLTVFFNSKEISKGNVIYTQEFISPYSPITEETEFIVTGKNSKNAISKHPKLFEIVSSTKGETVFTCSPSLLSNFNVYKSELISDIFGFIEKMPKEGIQDAIECLGGDNFIWFDGEDFQVKGRKVESFVENNSSLFEFSCYTCDDWMVFSVVKDVPIEEEVIKFIGKNIYGPIERFYDEKSPVKGYRSEKEILSNNFISCGILSSSEKLYDKEDNFYVKGDKLVPYILNNPLKFTPDYSCPFDPWLAFKCTPLFMELFIEKGIYTKNNVEFTPDGILCQGKYFSGYKGATKICHYGEQSLMEQMSTRYTEEEAKRILKQSSRRGNKTHLHMEKNWKSVLNKQDLSKLGEKIGHEIFLYGKIFDIDVLGFADAIFYNKERDVFTIVDYKTKSSRSSWNRFGDTTKYWMQLVIYAMLFNSMYKKKNIELSIFVLFEDSPSYISYYLPLNQRSKQYALAVNSKCTQIKNEKDSKN